MKFNLLCFSVLVFYSCNGIETDISKKLDFKFNVNQLDSVFYDTTALVIIPLHDEIDDYVDYAVGPNPFKINEISYRVDSIGGFNRSTQLNLSTSYISPTQDTVLLFQVANLPLVPGERVIADVEGSLLSALSNEVNTNGGFNIYTVSTANSDSTSFQLHFYFDTTISIDYDL